MCVCTLSTVEILVSDGVHFFLSALQSNVLNDHLMEELDYALVPKAAWEKFEQWYGLSQGSKPIER